MLKQVATARPIYICKNCQSKGYTLASHKSFPQRTSHWTAKRCFSGLKGLRQSAEDVSVSKEARVRFTELGGHERISTYFPRLQPDPDIPSMSAKGFLNSYESRYQGLGSDEEDRGTKVKIYGRLISKRRGSRSLFFLDIGIGTPAAQCLVKISELQGADASNEAMSETYQSMRRGDWIEVIGHPHKSSTGQFSLLAISLPTTLSPSLQPVPEKVLSPEFLIRNRHVNQIINSDARNILILRHKVIQTLRSFFEARDFVEVSTPLLVAGAGGAVARPFTTYATEFSETPLNLRVAPELFLKRLVVGNMEKVFEIGPAFRNEGVDATHNPEFTICEFYQVMTSLGQLMTMTEELFVGLATQAELILPENKLEYSFSTPFRRVEFIPALESAIRAKLPNWTFPIITNESAKDFLLQTLKDLNITLHNSNEAITTARILDVLAGEFIEPQCKNPTFITHHPECMSPLSKSFLAPDSPHRVSARAELFIDSREYVNCYEEENSPIEQRRKFEEQAAAVAAAASAKATANTASTTNSSSTSNPEKQAEAETHSKIDHNYLSALEWGLPPTGGWGCGVDRLVMLFSGGKAPRIADVLPFGNLTNVVGLSGTPSETKKAKKKMKKLMEKATQAENEKATVDAPQSFNADVPQ